MANDLKIERVLDTYYDIWLNSGDKIRDERPTIRSRDDYVIILSKVGSNLFKEQNILYSEVTVIDTFGGTGTFTGFASISALWLKLIEVKFIREDGSSSGGADLFTQLNDAFSFYGNDGKVPVVDEDKLKLVPTEFHNISRLIDLTDVEIPALSNGKILGVASVGGVNKVVQVNRPADGTTYFSAVGGFDYDDLGTKTTAISFTGTDVKLTNDTLGSSTFISKPPYGVTVVWDEEDGSFDFSQLSEGDEVILRINIDHTTSSANQNSGVYLQFEDNTIGNFNVNVDTNIQDKSSGTHNITRSIHFYVRDGWKNNPVYIYYTSDDDSTIVVNGWHPYIIRKSINVLDVNVQGGSDKPNYELATAGQTEIDIDSSADNVDIYINRVYQIEGLDYDRDFDTVTMNTPLDENDSIVKRYYTEESVKEPFIATEGQTSITLSSNPRNVDVIKDRVIQIENIDYTKSNNIITFTEALSNMYYIIVRKYR